LIDYFFIFDASEMPRRATHFSPPCPAAAAARTLPVERQLSRFTPSFAANDDTLRVYAAARAVDARTFDAAPRLCAKPPLRQR